MEFEIIENNGLELIGIVKKIEMKKVLYVLLPQFAEHEMPYLTQPLRSDSFAMKENPKYEYRQCQDGGIL